MGLSLIGQTNTTQIMRPATKIMRPATQIMRPATQIMHPATQIMRPATQIMRPATQIMRTTKRRGEHAYIKTCTTMVSTKWFMKIKLENLGKTLVTVEKFWFLSQRNTHASFTSHTPQHLSKWSVADWAGHPYAGSLSRTYSQGASYRHR